MTPDLAIVAGEWQVELERRRPRVAILCGPASDEDRAYYDATPSDSLSTLDLQRALARLGARSADAIDITTRPRWRTTLARYDLVVANLHGSPGEDGSIQGYLDVLGMSYLGSGVEASVVALNKNLAKLVALQLGVRTPAFVTASSASWTGAPTASPSRSYLHKPLRGGSSLGIVMRPDASPSAPGVLVEELLDGLDATVTVIEGRGLSTALPGVVLRHDGELYDSEAKLDTGRRLPARAERPGALEAALRRCEACAVAVHDAIGARHISRSDFVVVDGEPSFLEINTMPGLSERSNAAECAYAAGLGYDDFIALLVGPALGTAVTRR